MGRRRRRGRGRRIGLLLLLAVLLLLGAYVVAQRVEPPPGGAPSTPPAAGNLRVHYLEVGQGDAVVWELPDGSVALYDCGPPVAADAPHPVLRYLQEQLRHPPGSAIAALVASHGHLDHIGGCEEVFAEHVVERVYESWYEGADAPESYQRFQREVQAEGAVLHKLPSIAPGTRLDLPSVDARLLWPRAFAPGGWDAIAESSLVVRVVHGSTAFCFQGDIEERQERVLVDEQPAAACDAYLVGHHGSRSASSAAWLSVMDPEIAVVSYGENGYGHPTPEALCRIQQAGAVVHETPGAGAIILESDGARVRVAQGRPVTTDACAAP